MLIPINEIYLNQLSQEAHKVKNTIKPGLMVTIGTNVTISRRFIDIKDQIKL